MTEKLLQYIWQFQYFNTGELKTTGGEALEILHPGTLNTNQGPDFLNAKIRCGETVLAGSIEIHINSSEWQQHGHSNDKNYGNVILHAVWMNDRDLQRDFPTLELSNRISNILLEKYENLMQAKYFIPCEELIHNADAFTVAAWKERMLIERLQEKAGYAENLLEKNNHHWEEVFWQMLARNFGIKINSDAFEAVAASLPLNIIAKHKNQPLQLEALLMGQAGLLEKDFTDTYPIMLQKEYEFFKKKYALAEIHFPVHYLRMRPANFPTLRLSQLASLIHNSNHLFSRVKETENVRGAEKMFDVAANDYWHYHYVFDEASAFKTKNLGRQMIQNILLNTVIPMLYAYGWYNNTESLKSKALQWAEQLSPEKNVITAGFEKLGIENMSGYDSQALIQLKNNYCNKVRCLECAIGNNILKKS